MGVRMVASVVIWMVTMTISVSTVVLAAAARASDMHAYAAGIVSLTIAILAIVEHRKLVSDSATEQQIAASTARHMGLVWAWGALCLFVTYQPLFEILRWVEWLPFTLAFFAITVLCLIFSTALSREAEGDERFLRMARYLSVGQLIGMCIAIVGLMLDGKFPAAVKAHPDWQDWAANNVFFFGAVALAAITANALYSERQRNQQAATQA